MNFDFRLFSRHSLYSIGAFLIAILLGFSTYLFLAYSEKTLEFDEDLVSTIANISDIPAYSQIATTTFSQDGRDLVIVGRYYVDDQNRVYSSYSTTTLLIPTKEGAPEIHTFTHENIAIDNNVYVRVMTSSEVLKAQINHGSDWKRFKTGEIPKEYTDIAIPGPLLDALGVFVDSGAHLELVAQNIGISDRRELNHYTFRLRSVPKDKGYLTVVSSRLFPEGLIDVYADRVTKKIERISMKNKDFSNEIEIVIHHTPLSIATPTR